MKKIFMAATAVALLFSVAHAETHEKHWDYSQNGPAQWGEFSKVCATGKSQSPINIVSDQSTKLNSSYGLTLNASVQTNAKVIDNGHSIKVTPAKGGTISFNDETFKLLQFHFHGKSEHTIDGKRYDMVAHFVHQNLKTKQLAVVAVLFEEGKANPVLDSIINGIDKEIKINPADLLPSNTQHYFHYVGSLTTPPCSENVLWYVLKEPASASKNQIKAFRKYYLDNKRPVQALNDRKVESI